MYDSKRQSRPPHSGRAMLVAAFGALLMLTTAFDTVAQNAPARPAAPPPLEVLEFKPGLDDLMTLLVQPRHMKLFFAAEALNWELAAFQMKELRSSFRRLGATIPKYRNMRMDATVGSMMGPTMQALDAAIATKDSKKFATAYGALTDACNACHHVMEHAFLVVKVPMSKAGSAYPNQDFSSAGL